MLPLHEPITVEIESDIVSPEGRDQIQSWMIDHGYPTLPPNWCWTWVLEGRSQYTGRLPIRVSKFIYQEACVKITAEQRSEIGNIARTHMVTQNSFTIDFDNQFDWQAGDFGDGGSCYWGGKSEARRMLRREGAYALRYFQDGKGMGRAWLAPYHDKWIAFNSYGHDLFVTAQVLSKYLEQPYAEIELVNLGKHNGLLWVNGARGYWLGENPPVCRVDLNWIEITRCCYCNRALEHLRNVECGNYYYCDACWKTRQDYLEQQRVEMARWREQMEAEAARLNEIDMRVAVPTRTVRFNWFTDEFGNEQEITVTEEGWDGEEGEIDEIPFG